MSQAQGTASYLGPGLLGAVVGSEPSSEPPASLG